MCVHVRERERELQRQESCSNTILAFYNHANLGYVQIITPAVFAVTEPDTPKHVFPNLIKWFFAP